MKSNDTIVLNIIPSEFSNLNENIRKHLNTFEGQTFKNKGCVIKIYDFEIIGDMKISNTNGCVIVNVQYEFESFLPEIEQEYNVLVEHIYPEGVFTLINNVRILVPEMYLTDWKFVHKTLKKDEQQIKVGSWIKVKIVSTNFINGTYHCIAEFV